MSQRPAGFAAALCHVAPRARWQAGSLPLAVPCCTRLTWLPEKDPVQAKCAGGTASGN
ncbi:MAG TPA: hypothetical protein VJ946_01630 [Bacteroidales bacterium]|nr:hypothetical protein [Bacteroidales bacterium]